LKSQTNLLFLVDKKYSPDTVRTEGLVIEAFVFFVPLPRPRELEGLVIEAFVFFVPLPRPGELKV
jgi:hypothetical protein